MTSRLAELRRRREGLLAASSERREAFVQAVGPLAGPAHAIDRVWGVLRQLRLLPLGLLAAAVRAGAQEALGSRPQRARLYAGLATGAAALLRRWRARRQAPAPGGVQ